MKIAVIGATGFLVSNIIRYLPNKYKIVSKYTNKRKITKKLSNIKNIQWKFLDLHKKNNNFLSI